ncbi:MAG: HD domain-containing protein [Nitrospirae bacterium]|nr:HD domain-containing protein [Nitrospirota bacterium]
METIEVPQFEESILLQKRRAKADSLAWGLRNECAVFFDALKEGRDVREQKLFELLGQFVTQVQASPEVWLERVFDSVPNQYRRDFLVEHSLNVAIMAVALARDWSVDGKELLLLAAGALLHDVGMMSVGPAILDAPRSLTPEERAQVERHPAVGSAWLERLRLKRDLVEMVRQEHERVDGSGYPDRLKGAAIGRLARLVGLCDTIESVTHVRPHRAARPFVEACHTLIKESPDIFPRAVWMTALRRLTLYPPGSRVRLTTGKLARVVLCNPGHPMRPVVEFIDASEPATERPHLVDLRLNPMMSIREVLA